MYQCISTANNKQGMKSRGNSLMSLDNIRMKVTVREHGKKAAIHTNWPAAIPSLNSKMWFFEVYRLQFVTLKNSWVSLKEKVALVVSCLSHKAHICVKGNKLETYFFIYF